jgi:hypothetical protein
MLTANPSNPWANLAESSADSWGGLATKNVVLGCFYNFAILAMMLLVMILILRINRFLFEHLDLVID